MLTTVARFRDPWEAHMFRGLLDCEGLLAVVAFDRHVSVNWPISLALGEVQVQVASEDCDEARTIWQQVRSGEYEADLRRRVGGFDVMRCPRCQSTDFKRRFSVPTLGCLVLFTLLAMAIFPPRRKMCECRNCGNIWNGVRANVKATSPPP
jgi:hypothetical protein